MNCKTCTIYEYCGKSPTNCEMAKIERANFYVGKRPILPKKRWKKSA